MITIASNKAFMSKIIMGNISIWRNFNSYEVQLKTYIEIMINFRYIKKVMVYIVLFGSSRRIPDRQRLFNPGPKFHSV